MSNRDRVIAVALSAFNERGTHAVTTNHLAADAGVSVGNLYYHFKSKEQIIRTLFSDLSDAWRVRLRVSDPRRVTLADVDALIAEHFRIMWEYRFFFREQTALRQRDPALARRWTIAHRRGRADMRALLTALASQLRPGATLDDASLERITDVCWIVADYWLLFKESMGARVRRHDLDDGVLAFRAAVIPMLIAALAATSQESRP